MTDHAEWRELLQPPGGGLARLIDAIVASRHASRPPYRLALLAVGAVATAAVAVSALCTHFDSPEYHFQLAFKAALHPPPIRVENGTAIEAPTGDPNVRMYWIATAQSEANLRQ